MAILQEPIIAFVVLVLIYAIGDFVGTKTKAWIPSVFVVAVLFIAGYWTVFPENIVSIGGFGPPLGGILAIMLCITHMGTTISLKELGEQWKIVVIGIAGLAGMIVSCWFIAGIFVDKNYLVAGIPPLTGGIVAATMMQSAAAEMGLEKVSVLAISMYVVQGFAGYPLTAFFLKREGKKILKGYHGGEIKLGVSEEEKEKDDTKKRLFPAIPAKYYSTATSFAMMGVIMVLSNLVQKATASWGNFALNQAVVALILSVIATELGFLEKNVLKKNGTFNMLMLILLMFVFDGLKKATPAMLKEIAVPLVIIIVVGVTGMLVVSTLVAKLLGVSGDIARASSLTALYGFPPNYILTDEASKALAENDEEKQVLMDNMLPQMIVGGFVSVTITSVILAGIFIGMLRA